MGLKKKDLKLSGDAPLLLDTENSAVDRVGIASYPARLFSTNFIIPVLDEI